MIYLKALPFALAIIVGTAGYFKGREDGVLRGVKSVAMPKIPDCNCPKVEPCSPQIDFDKIKSKNVTIEAKTVTNFIVEGDSAYREIMKQDFRAILEELKVVRAKR